MVKCREGVDTALGSKNTDQGHISIPGGQVRDTSIEVTWHQASTLESGRKCAKEGKKQRESVGLHIAGLFFKGKQEKW